MYYLLKFQVAITSVYGLIGDDDAVAAADGDACGERCSTVMLALGVGLVVNSCQEKATMSV